MSRPIKNAYSVSLFVRNELIEKLPLTIQLKREWSISGIVKRELNIELFTIGEHIDF